MDRMKTVLQSAELVIERTKGRGDTDTVQTTAGAVNQLARAVIDLHEALKPIMDNLDWLPYAIRTSYLNASHTQQDEVFNHLSRVLWAERGNFGS